jgi:hypothetical protein
MALSYSSSFNSAEFTALKICFLAMILGAGTRVVWRYWVFWGDNGTSASAAMIACYCVAEVGSRKKWRKIMLLTISFITLTYLIFVGRSAGSMLAIACGMFFAALNSPRRRYIIIISLVSLFCAWLFNQRSLFGVLFPEKTVEQVISLHGRRNVWENFMRIFISSPLYGQGFAVSSKLSNISNTHSGFFAVLTGTGALGLIIVTYGLIRLLKELRNSILIQKPGAIGCTAALIVGLINCQTVPIIGEYWRAESVVFISFLALFLFYVRQPSARLSQSPCTLCSHSERFSDNLYSNIIAPQNGRLYEL